MIDRIVRGIRATAYTAAARAALARGPVESAAGIASRYFIQRRWAGPAPAEGTDFWARCVAAARDGLQDHTMTGRYA
jgi:hypothetical protein